jgi:hypothetical protein
VFDAARELGVPLLALNVDSEDLARVQAGGFPALGPRRMAKYIPEARACADFSTTVAFKEYANHVIRPSYELHRRLGLLPRTGGALRGELLAQEMPFSNFLSSRLLWDEAMGTRTASWLKEPGNQGGLIVSLVGSDHVKFGCGAAARCGRALGGLQVCCAEHHHVTTTRRNPHHEANHRVSADRPQHVRTVLLNPSSADTRPSAGGAFPALPLTSLQLQYAARPGDPRSGPMPHLLPPEADDRRRAHANAQAHRGSSGLRLADYLWYSRSLSVDDVLRPREVRAVGAAAASRGAVAGGTAQRLSQRFGTPTHIV